LRREKHQDCVSKLDSINLSIILFLLFTEYWTRIQDKSQILSHYKSIFSHETWFVNSVIQQLFLFADFTSLHSNELWASSVCNRKSRFTNFWLYHYRSASRGRSVATSFIVAVFTKYTNPCNFVSEPVRLEIHAISGDWYVLAHA